MGLSSAPIDSSGRFFAHKTTQRQAYEAARANVPSDWDDVLLWNKDGELTDDIWASAQVVELKSPNQDDQQWPAAAMIW